MANPTDISCKKSNENLVNQKLYNTVLILNALYYIDKYLIKILLHRNRTYPSPALDPSEGALPSRTSDGFELGSIGSLKEIRFNTP